jgi:L-asparagine oxygenase
MDMEAATHAMSRRGWHEIEFPVTEDLRGIVPLLRPELANRLDALQLERVSPKQASEARAGTMSSRWGLGAFPLHTERAHWRVPPRFLILRSVGEATDRPTTLLDSADLRLDRRLREELRTMTWRVSMGGADFSTTVLWRADNARMDYIRYDRCCMAPAVTEVGDRFSAVLEAANVVEHRWRPDTALVIDNWRMLHGRGTSDRTDYGRIIERVVVP